MSTTARPVLVDSISVSACASHAATDHAGPLPAARHSHSRDRRWPLTGRPGWSDLSSPPYRNRLRESGRARWIFAELGYGRFLSRRPHVYPCDLHVGPLSATSLDARTRLLLLFPARIAPSCCNRPRIQLGRSARSLSPPSRYKSISAGPRTPLPLDPCRGVGSVRGAAAEGRSGRRCGSAIHRRQHLGIEFRNRTKSRGIGL
jgi:hypothetical protein